VKAVPSSEQANVAGSVAENVKVAAVWSVVPLGPEAIVVSGGDVSGGGGGAGGGGGGAGAEPTVQVRVAGEESAFPAVSVARALNVWSPGASEL
jgi:hypothetical protein